MQQQADLTDSCYFDAAKYPHTKSLTQRTMNSNIANRYHVHVPIENYYFPLY
jgi:hypothetical protein